MKPIFPGARSPRVSPKPSHLDRLNHRQSAAISISFFFSANTAKASSEAARKEEEARQLRDRIAKTKDAIQAATLQKAALEGKVK